jgi:hypothetical protein
MNFQERAMAMAKNKSQKTTSSSTSSNQDESNTGRKLSLQERAMNMSTSKHRQESNNNNNTMNDSGSHNNLLFPITNNRSNVNNTNYTSGRSKSPLPTQSRMTKKSSPVATTTTTSPLQSVFRIISPPRRNATANTTTTTSTTVNNNKLYGMALLKRIIMFALFFGLLSLAFHEILNALQGYHGIPSSLNNDMKALVVRDALAPASPKETREFVHSLVSHQPESTRANINDMQVSVLWTHYQEERTKTQQLTVIVGALMGILIGLMMGGRA